ncbi:hypothetical protein AMS68_003046 [Peltaster fructicola]|uniref:Methyltransferase domain-containing protein n=1 Tax=Peltaster fructicola TaxID=286661 RepID=A0A6H0XSC9_9PEZI|nr:hypothetical protein AMS68_003046 [Peltaster fructicola]
MSRAPNGLAHILRNDTGHPDVEARSHTGHAELEVRDCKLSTWRENGRHYQLFGQGVPMFPCDEPEHERQDMLHQVVYGVLLRHLDAEKPLCQKIIDGETQIQPNVVANVFVNCIPSRVLDLGCGTGIWAIDVARRYPNAWVSAGRSFGRVMELTLQQIEGVDIVGAQPSAPSNVVWRTPRAGQPAVLDLDQPYWPSITNDTYSIIHASQLCGSITSWEHLAQNCFRTTASGGWFESIEIDFEPRCDDGTLAPSAPICSWWHYMRQATKGRSIEYPHHLPDILHRAGFTNIQRITIPLPTSKWAYDFAGARAWAERIMLQIPQHPMCGQLLLPRADWTSRIKDVGDYMEILLTNDATSFQATHFFNGLSMRPFTQCLGWRREQVDRLVEDLVRSASDKSCHTYFAL